MSVALQFLRYGAAGGMALLVHLAALWFLVEALGLNATLASGIGFLCAIPVNYALQYRFVFNSSAPHRSSFVRYVSVTLASLALNVGVFWALVSLLPGHYLAVQIVTTAVVFVANFLVNRAYTFVDLDAGRRRRAGGRIRKAPG